MLIIVDKRLPVDAKNKLKTVVGASVIVGAGRGPAPTVIEFETNGIVYPAISGHPDIFFCKTPDTLIVSPNLPVKYLEILSTAGVGFVIGNQASGIRHPASVHYNAAVNNHYLVHRIEYTDPVILENCHYLKKINVSQGYTRCNMAWLKDDHYVTSDIGIHRTLQEKGLDGLFVSPEGILLPGFPYGFIGGTIGVYESIIFFTGSLSHFPEGEKLRNYLVSLDYEITELYDGPLVDGGGILLMKNEE